MTPFIPPPTINKMKDQGISEWEIMDVFKNGEYKKTKKGIPMAVKKYRGYEIGFFYSRSANTGEYTITAVWKRERR